MCQVVNIFNQQVVSRAQEAFSFGDLGLDFVRVYGRLVNVEQGYIAIEHLVQQDDELHQIGVGLLPEGFLATPKQIVEKRSDTIRQRISLQFVVQGVISVGRVYCEFNIV